jgi:hypothetical protein
MSGDSAHLLDALRESVATRTPKRTPARKHDDVNFSQYVAAFFPYPRNTDSANGSTRSEQTESRRAPAAPSKAANLMRRRNSRDG